MKKKPLISENNTTVTLYFGADAEFSIDLTRNPYKKARSCQSCIFLYTKYLSLNQ